MVPHAILVLLVGFCCLSAYNPSFGFARPLEEKDSHTQEEGVNDLSPEMKKDIRKLLNEAVNKIDESDVLRALKRSLYFRMRMCFSQRRLPGTPFPSPVRNDTMQSDSDDSPFSLEESDNEYGLSAEQKREVRIILEEALKSIDDAEILQALKRSLILRLKLCLRAGIRSSRSPRPYPTRFSKRSMPPTTGTQSLKPTNPSTGIPTSAKPNDTESNQSPGHFDAPKLENFLSRDFPRADSEKQAVDSASLDLQEAEVFEAKPQQDVVVDPELATKSTMEAVNERRQSSLQMS